MKYTAPRDMKKILIIKNDKIGDMVLSAGIFRELRNNFPKAKITVIASQSNKSIIEKNRNIDKILVLGYPPKSYEELLNYFKLSKELKKEKFDLGIDLRGSIINIFFLLNLARVKYKIGFYNRYFSKFFLDYAYKKDRENKHVTFQRIDLINNALNLNSKNYWPEIATDKADKKKAGELIEKNKLKKFICIVPDASLEVKQWPLERFDEIIKYLRAHYNKYKIVLIGADKEKVEWLYKRNPTIIAPDELLNLRVSYLLFKRSDLVIAHDGGPMHMAWTSKANLIALMPKHLNLNYYGPLGRNVKILSEEIKDIGTEKVKLCIDELLNKK